MRARPSIASHPIESGIAVAVESNRIAGLQIDPVLALAQAAEQSAAVDCRAPLTRADQSSAKSTEPTDRSSVSALACRALIALDPAAH